MNDNSDQSSDGQTDEANSISPLRLEKTESRELLIEWSDGRTDLIPFLRLRKGCQCAHCIDDRIKEMSEPVSRSSGVLPVISAAQAQPMGIIKMTPIGNYGYNVTFTDGHSSGIYTFDLLRSIGEI